MKEVYIKGSRTIRYFVVCLFFIILFGVNTINRAAWFLDFLILMAVTIFLIGIRKRFEFSNVSLLCLTIFMVLNLIGWNYGMENVPLDEIMNLFNLVRNPYDRVVHFASGLLLFYPLKEILQIKIKTKKNFMFFLTFLAIMGIAGIYEVLEWIGSQIISPAAAGVYLGLQGDSWDAQKDMIMAGLGSLFYIFLSFLYNLKTRFRKSGI